MPIQSINPATGELLRSFEALTEEATKHKIDLAHQAFTSYDTIPLDHRALWMRKLAGLLEDEVEDQAALITREVGKTITAARAEVAKCALCCRYYADHAAEMLAAEELSPNPLYPARSSFVRWEPLGVLLAVMPWNFPFWQVFRFLAPALMAGNTALLKHAPSVPQCALMLEALVRRAGFPRGSFQTLLLESSQVDAVLSDERVAAVTVTGSETAGRAVAARAGWLVKKSVLELGGSDPFLVMPSANLEQAVNAAVRSRTQNNGQSCIAAKRIIVHQDIYDEFERRFVEAMGRLRIGDPTRDDTDIGPLATTRLLEQLEAQVQAAQQAGAILLSGGERLLGAGNYYEPTVLADLPRNSAVYRDEIFGPVALLFRAATLDQALEIANDTPFGLAASVWTADAREQKRAVAGLQCGAVFLNAMVASDPSLPFGGIKRSGYGRELSAAGMREFLNAKTVVITEPVPVVPSPMDADTTDEPEEFSTALEEDTLSLSSSPVPQAGEEAEPQFDARQFRAMFEDALNRRD